MATSQVAVQATKGQTNPLFRVMVQVDYSPAQAPQSFYTHTYCVVAQNMSAAIEEAISLAGCDYASLKYDRITPVRVVRDDMDWH